MKKDSKHVDDYVLIVDDDAASARLLEIRLENTYKGLKVEKTLDGRIAVDIAREKKPNLVFVDLVMPQINGYEVIKRLRTYDEKMHICALSSIMTKNERKSAIKAGANDAYNKDGFDFIGDIVKKVYNR